MVARNDAGSSSQKKLPLEPVLLTWAVKLPVSPGFSAVWLERTVKLSRARCTWVVTVATRPMSPGAVHDQVRGRSVRVRAGVLA